MFYWNSVTCLLVKHLPGNWTQTAAVFERMPQIGFLASLTKLLGKQWASHSLGSPERYYGWLALESLSGSKPSIKTRILLQTGAGEDWSPMENIQL